MAAGCSARALTHKPGRSETLWAHDQGDISNSSSAWQLVKFPHCQEIRHLREEDSPRMRWPPLSAPDRQKKGQSLGWISNRYQS
jgi:hypothetical protein